MEITFRDMHAGGPKATILRQRNHDLIFIPHGRATSPWTSLRIPEETHRCLIYGRYKISNTQLDRLADALLGRKRSFHLLVTADGSHFSRQDTKRWLSRELEKRNVPVSDEADVILYVFCIDEAYYVCLLHSGLGDLPDRRSRVAERAGSLPPTIAAAMAFLGKPKSTDLILDPVCGTGTLLAEVFAFAPDARMIGVDIDAEALEAAGRNLSHVPGCELIQADGARTGLPEESVTLFLANLPFGKRFGSRETNPELYTELLAEMQRIGVPGSWRAVLLSSDVEALDGALARFPSLTVGRRVRVSVRGEIGTIFLVNS